MDQPNNSISPLKKKSRRIIIILSVFLLFDLPFVRENQFQNT